MKQFWHDGEKCIFFIIIVFVMFVITQTLFPYGHTITKYELEYAQEFCGDSGIYEIDTYAENSVTCNNGDSVGFYSLVNDNKK